MSDLIKDANIKIYPKGADMTATPAEHIVELTTDDFPKYDIYYGPAVLTEGDYFALVSAPDKGSKVVEFSITSDSSKEIFKDGIALKNGISSVLATLSQWNESTEDKEPLIQGIKFEVSKLRAESGGDGTYTIANVPEGENTIRVYPEEGYEGVVQPYRGTVSLTDSNPNIVKTIYPPFSLRVSCEDNGIPYTSGEVWLVTESGSKIPNEQLVLQADGRYVYSRLWDATHRIAAFNSMGIRISSIVALDLSYLNNAPSYTYKLSVDGSIK